MSNFIQAIHLIDGHQDERVNGDSEMVADSVHV